MLFKFSMYLDPEGNGRQRHSKITATVGLVVHAAGKMLICFSWWVKCDDTCNLQWMRNNSFVTVQYSAIETYTLLPKAEFHWWWSRSPSYSRSHKSTNNPVITCSHKWSHKIYKIRVGRIIAFPFLSFLFTTPSLITWWKLDCQSRKQKKKNQPVTKSSLFFCFYFQLWQSSFLLDH